MRTTFLSSESISVMFYGRPMVYLCTYKGRNRFRVDHESGAMLHLQRSVEHDAGNVFEGFYTGDRNWDTSYALDPEGVCFFSNYSHVHLRDNLNPNRAEILSTGQPDETEPEPFEPGLCPVDLLDDEQRSMFWLDTVKVSTFGNGELHLVEKRVWRRKPGYGEKRAVHIDYAIEPADIVRRDGYPTHLANDVHAWSSSNSSILQREIQRLVDAGALDKLRRHAPHVIDHMDLIPSMPRTPLDNENYAKIVQELREMALVSLGIPPTTEEPRTLRANMACFQTNGQYDENSEKCALCAYEADCMSGGE